MKKNVLMRAASGLLVATMLTTCAISGTFAKYVTQDNGGDMARVAKWGVVVQVEGDLYSQQYYNSMTNGNDVTPGNVAADETVTDSKIGVNGTQAPANVVAPGTKSNENFSFNINGTPEVDSRLTVKITHQNVHLAKGEYGVMVKVPDGTLNSENFDEIIDPTDYYSGLFIESDGTYSKVTKGTAYNAGETYYTLEDYVENTYNNYYPVVYSLKNNDGEYKCPSVETDDDSIDTLEVITNAIFAKITNAQGGKLEAGTITANGYKDKHVWSGTATSGIIENNNDLSQLFELSDAKLAWEWNFNDTQGEDTTYKISTEDKLDTILGNLMAERVNSNGYDGKTDFNGKVVKLSEKATGSWKAPVEATNGEAKDFCLDTQFAIDILVEQVD